MCLQILHIVLVSLLFFLNKEILLEIFYGGVYSGSYQIYMLGLL